MKQKQSLWKKIKEDDSGWYLAAPLFTIMILGSLIFWWNLMSAPNTKKGPAKTPFNKATVEKKKNGKI